MSPQRFRIFVSSVQKEFAEERRDCYWLYRVTDCNPNPTIQEPIKDPAKFPWNEVPRVADYYL